jgi:hypothetical protein
VLAFASYLEAQGHQICRLQLRPKGEPAPLYCDLFDKTTNTLYEAKGSTSRAGIRMAIGQLADYSRLTDQRPKRAVLLPEGPRPDLVDLLTAEGIDIVHPTDGAFGTT